MSCITLKVSHAPIPLRVFILDDPAARELLHAHCSAANKLLRHQVRDVASQVRAVCTRERSADGSRPDEAYVLVLQHFVQLLVKESHFIGGLFMCEHTGEAGETSGSSERKESVRPSEGQGGESGDGDNGGSGERGNGGTGDSGSATGAHVRVFYSSEMQVLLVRPGRHFRPRHPAHSMPLFC